MTELVSGAGVQPVPAARVTSGGVGAILTGVSGFLILGAIVVPWATALEYDGYRWTRYGFEMDDWPYLALCGLFILGVGIARHAARIHWLWQVLPIIPGAFAGFDALWYIHNISNLIESAHASAPWVGGYFDAGPIMTLIGGLLAVIGGLGFLITPIRKAAGQ